jgi:hypothetical protein
MRPLLVPHCSCLCYLAAIGDGDGVGGSARVSASGFDPLDDVVALSHLSEHHVASIQPGAQHGGDEELGMGGVKYSIGA